MLVGAAATAASIEAPSLGVLGLAFFAHPRLRRRPVAVGAAAATTLATLAVWPTVVDGPAHTRPVVDRRLVDPLPDGRGLVVVANPSSGSDDGSEVIDRIRRDLPEANVVELNAGDDPLTVLDEAARSGVALGVVGGDGTVNAAARVAGNHDVPLVVFPGGTLNHFARTLGLERIDDAIAAVNDGSLVAVDLAAIGTRWFVNNASLGCYCELVDERERLEDRLGKWPAMAVAAMRIARHGEPIEVSIDGRSRRVWMAFFGNGRYEPAGFAPMDRADLTDGMLDVRVLDARQPFSRIRVVVALAIGTLAPGRVYDAWAAARVDVEVTSGRSRLAADGETFDGPASFSVVKKPLRLRVLVPGHDEVS